MRNSSTLLHRLYLWFLDTPNAPAQIYKKHEQKWHTVTVADFWLQVVRIAHYLQVIGLQRGDRVVLYAMNSPQWVQWELGAWLAGCISTGIHPSTSQRDLELILGSSDPKLILVESDLFLEKILGSSSIVLTFKLAEEKVIESVTSDEKALVSMGEALLSKVDANQTQLVVYTSGSSGAPKGVMLGLKQLSFVADSLSREWNLPFTQGILFSFLPLSHIAEKIQAIAVAITQRYPVWFNSTYENFSEELKEVRPTMLLAVPRVWEKIKEEVENQKPKLLRRVMEFEKIGPMAEKLFLSQVKEKLGLDRLTLAVSGAAKLATSTGKWYQSLGLEIQEIYGMSESCGLITLTRGKRGQLSCVGKAPLGVEVKLTSEGEVWFRGENAFFGYDQDSEETKNVILEDGWVKTGDLGEWIDDAELNIIGRNREIIKLSNGRMVAPLPIENAFREIEELANVCIVGEGRANLMALITLKESVLMEYKFIPGAIEGLSVEDEALKAKIAAKIKSLYDEGKIQERVHRFVLLSRDFSIDQKEMTSTQKLNRNQILKNFRYFIDLAYEY